MARLNGVPRKSLQSFRGGISVGDPCEAFAHHGYNGIERDVVQHIATWLAGN